MDAREAIKAHLAGQSGRDSLRQFKPAELITVLIENFTDKDWGVRKKSAELLRGFAPGDVFPILMEKVEPENTDHSFWSLKLAPFLLTAQSLALIRIFLRSKNKASRIFAIEALEQTEGTDKIDMLIDCLKDTKWSVRKKASDALNHMPEAVPRLAARFSRATEDQSYWIIRIMGKLLAEKDLDLLLKSLKSRDHKKKFFAIMALSETRSQKAIPGLINCLGDHLWVIRRQAAEVLEKFGLEAVPFLQDELKHSSDQNIRFWIPRVLAKIGQEKALPFFQEMYDNSGLDLDMRCYVVMALDRINSDKIFDLLIKAFDDDYWLIRKQAHEIAVGKGQAAVAPLVLHMEKALREDNENVCHWSIKVLLKLKGLALEPLRKYLHGSNTAIKNLIMMLFYEFKDPATFEVLNEALEDDNWSVRSLAAKTISAIGGSVLPKLQQHFSELTPPVRRDRCFWVKKILLDGGPDGRRLYQTTTDRFRVKDLMELAGDTSYDDSVDLSNPALAAEAVIAHSSVSPQYIENCDALVSKDLRLKVENIFSDLLAEYEEVRMLALNSLLSLSDLPGEMKGIILERLAITEFLADPAFLPHVCSATKAFLERHKLERWAARPEELKAFDWQNIDDRWEKLRLILLLFHLHPERFKRDLLAIMEKEKDPVVLRGLIKLCPAFPDSLVSDNLFLIFKNSGIERIKRQALASLGGVSVARSAVVLIPVLASSYKYTVVNAMIKLGETILEKALKDLTFLDEKLEWLSAMDLLEEIQLPCAHDIIMNGLAARDHELREKALSLFSSYLTEDLIFCYEAMKSKFPVAATEACEQLIGLYRDGKLAGSPPKSLAQWKEFLSLIESQETLPVKRLAQVKHHEESPEKTDASAEELMAAVAGGENLSFMDESEWLAKVGELVSNLMKHKLLTFNEAYTDLQELIKIDDSIERRKDYIFKLQQDSQDSESKGFLDKIRERKGRKSEIEMAEKMVVHLLQKRFERLSMIGGKLAEHFNDLSNPPWELVQLYNQRPGSV
ncbi:MAG: HEAT repeat domain-containing protein [Candidatus Wallbacteria bacterium]|nr:HEAT repeat domain-containing protein [Candidatus Wallbacteria bacterium]